MSWKLFKFRGESYVQRLRIFSCTDLNPLKNMSTRKKNSINARRAARTIMRRQELTWRIISSETCLSCKRRTMLFMTAITIAKHRMIKPSKNSQRSNTSSPRSNERLLFFKFETEKRLSNHQSIIESVSYRLAFNLLIVEEDHIRAYKNKIPYALPTLLTSFQSDIFPTQPTIKKQNNLF